MCQMSVNRTKSFAIVQIVHIEQLLGVLGNTGTGTFIFEEQRILSIYFQGTRELRIRLLGYRE